MGHDTTQDDALIRFVERAVPDRGSAGDLRASFLAALREAVAEQRATLTRRRGVARVRGKDRLSRLVSLQEQAAQALDPVPETVPDATDPPRSPEATAPTLFGESFLADLSHQVRNALFAISANLDVLGFDAPAESLQTLQHARVEVRRIGSILQDLAELRGPLAPVALDVSLGSIVERAVSAARGASSPTVSIAVSLDPAGVSARVDASLVERALVRLLEHALLRSSPSGAVRVEGPAPAPGETDARLRVIDAGSALSDETLGRALRPFGLVGGGRTGLGLAVARRLIEANGGGLTLERGGNGVGLCACVRLPRPRLD